MSDERKIVKCRGCGADIFFEHGVPWYARKVPVLIENDHPNGPGSAKTSGYVSHFINCPKASEFSKQKTEGGSHGEN